MLTVRHIDPIGHETIQEVRDTLYCTRGFLTGKEDGYIFDSEFDGSLPYVVAFNEGIPHVHQGGKVYVMNAGGKTVAVYDMGLTG